MWMCLSARLSSYIGWMSIYTNIRLVCIAYLSIRIANDFPAAIIHNITSNAADLIKKICTPKLILMGAQFTFWKEKILYPWIMFIIRFFCMVLKWSIYIKYFSLVSSCAITIYIYTDTNNIHCKFSRNYFNLTIL